MFTIRPGTMRLAAFIVILTFALCGVTQAQDSRPYAGVEIRVAMIDEPREWAFRDRLAQFEELTGIKATIDTFGFNDLFNKVLTASAGHTGEYDVLQIHTPDMALFDGRGFMVDLTDWIQRDAEEMQLDDFAPAVQDVYMKYDGRYYGVGTHVGGMNFYYRKDIFDAEGLAVPTTWDEVLSAAQTIDAKYAPEMRGFVFMGRADIQGAANFQNILGAYGGSYFDLETGRPTMDSEAALEAMNMLVELTKYSVPESPSFGFDEAQTSFKQGQAAMIPFWDSGDSFFSNAEQSQVVGKWAVAPMPGGHATLGGWSVQVSKDSPNPEAAFEFLKWIVSPQMERDLVPLTPAARTSVLSDPANAEYPSYQGFLDLVNGSPFPFPKIPPNLEILQYVAEAENAVITGQMTPEDSLANLQSRMEISFLRYGLWQP